MNRTFIFILTFCVVGFIACNSGEKKQETGVTTDIVNNPVTADDTTNKGNLPVMSFEKELHDFGAIIQGEKVSYTFKFKNSGGSDLIITTAKGSCGCTVPKYNREPIPAGKSGEIEIVFDSSGKSGIQNKTITVVSNAQPNTKVLTIAADVIVPNNN